MEGCTNKRSGKKKFGRKEVADRGMEEKMRNGRMKM
jgi:hypothetical protein